MPHNPSNHWLTIRECGALYMRDHSTILRWCRNGTFFAFGSQVMQVRYGRQWRYFIRQSEPIFHPLDTTPTSPRRT